MPFLDIDKVFAHFVDIGEVFCRINYFADVVDIVPCYFCLVPFIVVPGIGESFYSVERFADVVVMPFLDIDKVFAHFVDIDEVFGRLPHFADVVDIMPCYSKGSK